MTDYEDYTTTSKNYDSGRQVVGLEAILGAICISVKGKLNQAHVLDIGCGTGNYIAAISPYVATATGVEYNPGMLEKARNKTKELPNVTLMSGDATNLPLEDGKFDAVLSTQMIHHLPREGFLALAKMISEAYRVLVNNGVFIINTSSPEQNTQCWVGSGLATNKTVYRYPSIEKLSDMLTEGGFRVGSTNSLTHEHLMQPHVLLNEEGPLSKEWRDLDSAWSALSEEELQAAQEKWRKKRSDGTLQEMFRELKERIRRIGETTTVIAYKEH